MDKSNILKSEGKVAAARAVGARIKGRKKGMHPPKKEMKPTNFIHKR